LRESGDLRHEARIHFGEDSVRDLLDAAADFAEVYSGEGLPPKGPLAEVVAECDFLPNDVLIYPIREDATFVFEEVVDPSGVVTELRGLTFLPIDGPRVPTAWRMRAAALVYDLRDRVIEAQLTNREDHV
jgi:hypothetical protein